MTLRGGIGGTTTRGRRWFVLEWAGCVGWKETKGIGCCVCINMQSFKSQALPQHSGSALADLSPCQMLSHQRVTDRFGCPLGPTGDFSSLGDLTHWVGTPVLPISHLIYPVLAALRIGGGGPNQLDYLVILSDGWIHESFFLFFSYGSKMIKKEDQNVGAQLSTVSSTRPPATIARLMFFI